MLSCNIVAMIQARTGSTRLPNKVLRDIDGKPMLQHVIERVIKAPGINQVVVVTTTDAKDDRIRDMCNRLRVACFRGNENDVLDRFYRASREFTADAVVRITADCPLLDSKLISTVIQAFRALYPSIDYASNTLRRVYPRGLDVEVINISALSSEWHTAIEHREHVTAGIRSNPGMYRIVDVGAEGDYSHMRWCVDTQEDLDFVRKVYKHFHGHEFGWRDVLALLEEHPEWVVDDTQVDPVVAGREVAR